MKTCKGFTLTELMIVLVIVSILAAIAYPSYQAQVRSTKRTDCSGTLLAFAGAMERFFTANNTYVGAGTAGVGGNTTGAPILAVFPTQCPINGGTATYLLTINVATASTFTLNAARAGAQAGDKCGTLTLTNTGLKGITSADAGITPQDCW
ncbi:MAG TPA: type IV pilin protein [Gammaproteobacteria bacterium]|nr:type IV pilin protein [Gammaproteobacteria bacterium]